ncbi:bpX6 domain-containing protein [Microtetraspora malaysiensis]|uniref:bpX6 domain-containing protein n=1 Tax=Microtetraspora malaysiensis TaxID=161358 RepID=UPI003D8FCE3D
MSAQDGFRGRVCAAGFIVDVPLIGEPEARRRVIEHWQDGAELRVLPDARWLLRLPEHVDVRAELAPGLPVRAVAGSLVSPGADGSQPGEITWMHAGDTRTEQIEALPVLRPADWLDSTGLRITELKSIQAPERSVSPVEQLDKVEAPDLRAAAKIGRSSSRAERAMAQLHGSRAGEPTGRVWHSLLAGLLPFVGMIGTAALAVAVIALIAVMLRGSGLHIGPLGVVGITMILYRLLRRGRADTITGRAGGYRDPRWQRVRSALARLTLRTPAVPLVERRHQRYLRELARAFEQRRWDDALREAIALGGADAESRLLTMRLPERRGELRPSPTAGSGAAALPYGPTIYQHLHGLYRTAAKELESGGRVEEAAFVLADLLNAPGEAVDLLERHKRWRMAAELAEGRELSPDLVVRLWWQAGNRDRAIDIARSRGAFATGILHLARVDADAARDLRRAWVHDRQAAADHVGAVEAAWPEETLRPLVVADIQAGIALGGPDAAYLFAYLTAFRPSEAACRTARALLGGSDADGLVARARFGTAFAQLQCADPAADRAIATAGLRALVRDGGWALDGSTLDRVTKALSGRADPLAAADLPRPVRRRPRPQEELLSVTAGPPGTVAVFDAAVLGGGAVLVACGDAGTFLLTRDGRVRARWGIPAHQLVVADHGGTALLVTHRESVSDVHRLDLVTRRARHWTSLRVHKILSSYDGGLLIALGEEGIVVFDVLAVHPRVVWREMTDASTILSANRTPSSITALGLIPVAGRPGSHLLQAWRWDLPTWTLRGRTSVESDQSVGVQVLASGGVLSPHLHGDPVVSTDGDVYSTVSASIASVRGPAGDVMFRAVFPETDGQALGLRSHAGITTVFDHRGRVVAVDTCGDVQANLRVRT